jgi:hypothetical protein
MKKALCQVVLILGVSYALWFSQHVAAQELGGSIAVTTNGAPRIGEPFTISPSKIDEASPVVIYNAINREYLVLWKNIRTVTNDIYAQRISEEGRFLSWFYVADGESPAVSYNEKNNTYLVVYEKWVATDYDIYARRINFTGPLGPEFPIAFNLNESERDPSVAYNIHPYHDEFLVVWAKITAQPLTTSRVIGQRIAGTVGGGDAGGETIGGHLPIAASSDYDLAPDVAYNLNMNEFFVVFSRYDSIVGSNDVFGRRVTADGILLAETSIDSSGNDQYEPAVAAYSLNQATPYLVVFQDRWNDSTGDVRGYLVNQQGQPVSLVNISQIPGVREFEPSISQSENWDGYLVTWTQQASGDKEIYGMHVSNIGATRTAFLISRYDPNLLGCDRGFSDNALGVVSGLAVWHDNCGDQGGYDIVGRLLGYRVYLPMTMQ